MTFSEVADGQTLDAGLLNWLGRKLGGRNRGGGREREKGNVERVEDRER